MPSRDVTYFCENYAKLCDTFSCLRYGDMSVGLSKQVFCALCAAKLEDSSRINVRGRSSFPVEYEIRKLPIGIIIDECTRICLPCLRKLKKRKSLEENFAAITEEIVRNFRSSVQPQGLMVPIIATPTKGQQPTPRASSTPHRAPTTCASTSTPASTMQPRQLEPGVTVSRLILCWTVLLQQANLKRK